MSYRYWTFAVASLCMLSPAWAEDCGPLISYGTVPLTQIPGETSEFVPIEIAGVQKLMMLDTGASVSIMKTSTANELNLKAYHTDFQIFDVTGNRSNQYVTAPAKLAGLKGTLNFMLGTPYINAISDSSVVGLLGADIMKKFDISIDFGAHTFTMLNSNHCDGRVVYWPERPVAIVPFDLQGDAIVLTVTLDGHEFEALLDTGAGRSTLDQSKAEGIFRIVLGSADTPVTGDLNGKGDTTWAHSFKSLSLAGLEVANPNIEIIPDKISEKVNTWSTGTQIDKLSHSFQMPHMLLGMDVLQHLHIYIAFKEKKLYITPAGKPAESALPAPTPEATTTSTSSPTSASQ